MAFKCGNMNFNFSDAVCYLTFPSFEKYDNLRHGFSTRLGGVSDGIYKSMNLNFNKGDKVKNVRQNFEIISKAIGVDIKSLVAAAQTHSTNIRKVTIKEKGIGIYRSKDLNDIDGLITNEKNITLVTYYADCVPIYFYDDKNKVIALAHAGWRGTVNKIAEKMIYKMTNEFNSDVKNIKTAIGPSIGPCCFEVDSTVASEFHKKLESFKPHEFISKKDNGKYYIDLWLANRKMLESSGILPENVEVADVCTSCNDGLLISHRKTKGQRGGMAAMLCMV